MKKDIISVGSVKWWRMIQHASNNQHLKMCSAALWYSKQVGQHMSVFFLKSAVLPFCEWYLVFFVVAFFVCQVTVIPSSAWSTIVGHISLVGFPYCNLLDSKFFNGPCFSVCGGYTVPSRVSSWPLVSNLIYTLLTWMLISACMEPNYLYLCSCNNQAEFTNTKVNVKASCNSPLLTEKKRHDELGISSCYFQVFFKGLLRMFYLI